MLRPVSFSSPTFGRSPRFGDVENRNNQPSALASAILGPGGTSFWMGTYTPIPEPPLQARMQMSVETAGPAHLYVNYLIWDNQSQRFKRQDVHYAASNGLFATNAFSERGGFVQDVHDGEVLYGGVLVDQLRRRLILPNSLFMDGPTGNILDGQGRIVKRFREETLVPRMQYLA
jgi:hypothetical protein